MPDFARYLGIDYSGAQTSTSPLPGLRVFEARAAPPPAPVAPPASARRHWTRASLAHWLAAELEASAPTLVAIDHAFGFPLPYFETHHLAPDWETFLIDFQTHWPTDQLDTSVDFIRHGHSGKGAARTGSARWRRLADARAQAKSPFHFDVPGSVAKSTHAGLPWLLQLRRTLGARLHFWPFDGWNPPPGCHVIAEGYPALCSARYARNPAYDAHQHDAYALCRWLWEQDRNATLSSAFAPDLNAEQAATARIEGWILGLR